ncbi:MAG: Fur family transcriptional regulator, stress-responsive regulator [Pseudonocardiales bacterium]|jgi:Fur family ferric uptake transcriptional regulator|nr:Fur family transcriptional regulator, stress-responsive regulator [Pseudonocardiales bacterium]
MSSADVSHQLRQAGLRVTAPRQSVLQWLAEHPHATAEQVRCGVAQRLGSVSTQTVYDVLAACTSAGLVRRIEPAGHPARFERRTGDNHHHVVCRSCGRTDDVDCAVNLRPCLTPSVDHGYLLDEAEVVFWGTCPSCQDPLPATRPQEPDDNHYQEAPQ